MGEQRVQVVEVVALLRPLAAELGEQVERRRYGLQLDYAEGGVRGRVVGTLCSAARSAV